MPNVVLISPKDGAFGANSGPSLLIRVNALKE